MYCLGNEPQEQNYFSQRHLIYYTKGVVFENSDLYNN